MERLNSIELKLPARFAQSAITHGRVDELRIFLLAKMEGHRANIKELFEKHKINERTGRRAIKKILAYKWATTDGEFLFCRSWKKLNYKRRGSPYIFADHLSSKPKFTAYIFASALRKLLRDRAYATRDKSALELPAELGTDYTASYIATAFGLSEPSIKRYKKACVKYGFIEIQPQTFTVLGPDTAYAAIRQHTKEGAIFIRGKNTVRPHASKITVILPTSGECFRRVR